MHPRPTRATPVAPGPKPETPTLPACLFFLGLECWSPEFGGWSLGRSFLASGFRPKFRLHLDSATNPHEGSCGPFRASFVGCTECFHSFAQSCKGSVVGLPAVGGLRVCWVARTRGPPASRDCEPRQTELSQTAVGGKQHGMSLQGPRDPRHGT